METFKQYVHIIYPTSSITGRTITQLVLSTSYRLEITSRFHTPKRERNLSTFEDVVKHFQGLFQAFQVKHLVIRNLSEKILLH